ncbi:hypothetical protein NE452_17010, partial [Paeniclostridium sordellii]|uniref:hypothetical protein n=1 Tax=Paraclostridium sordellii TaxID=1505 RepID=UPI00210CD8E2
MVTEISYKYVLNDFNSYSRALLESVDENSCRTNLIRFKYFIDNNEIIKSIIKEATTGKELININDFLVLHPGGCFYKIYAPEDIGDHILAMYKFLELLCSNEEKYSINSLSVRLIPKTEANLMQNFINRAFSPLFNYIKNELEKGALKEEENNKKTVV